MYRTCEPAGVPSGIVGFLALRLRRVGNRTVAALVVMALLVMFHVNGSLMEEGDAVPNVNLPLALLHRGTLSFSPDDFPEMFSWKSKSPLYETDDFFVRTWRWPIGTKTAGQWRDEGYLALGKPYYHTVESLTRHVYLSVFGPIPGLTFTPLVALLKALDPNFGSNALLLLSAAKLHAALLVAASAALLYLTAVRFVSQKNALLVAGAYGLGTCAWSIASQTLWQQTASTFFLCLGLHALLRPALRPRDALLSGFVFGTAAACRPTLALFLFAAIYVAWKERRALFLPTLVALASLVPLSAIGAYNAYYFGSALAFGQQSAGHAVAFAKTGSPNLWQTPLGVGALGLLASPSRGLLVFSPFAAFSLLGAVRAFGNAHYRALRPVVLASAGVMAVQCKWFDWWGGWTYGYRPWLDAVPMLALCLLPALESIRATPVRRRVFAGMLAWSFFVQLLGALTYDKSWNARKLFVVAPRYTTEVSALYDESGAFEYSNRTGQNYLGPTYCNVDVDYCRYRLWSFRDSIIGYYLGRFGESRRNRFPTAWRTLAPFRKP